MRLKSGIWVQAYIRRCAIEGAYAVVRRRGADEAGAVFVKIDRLDGTADLFGPAPQAVFDEGPQFSRQDRALIPSAFTVVQPANGVCQGPADCRPRVMTGEIAGARKPVVEKPRLMFA
jgi:hypothetical protein